MDGGVDTHVASDLPCVGCGYNLRTQPWNGSCPECARPVEASRATMPFRYPSLQAVRRVKQAVALLVIGLILAVAYGIAMRVSLVGLEWFRDTLNTDGRTPFFWFTRISIVHHPWARLSVVAITLGLALLWRVDAGMSRSTRKWHRVLGGLGIMGSIAGLYVAALGIWAWYSTPLGWLASVSAFIGRTVATVAPVMIWVLLIRQIRPGRLRGLRVLMWIMFWLNAGTAAYFIGPAWRGILTGDAEAYPSFLWFGALRWRPWIAFDLTLMGALGTLLAYFVCLKNALRTAHWQ